MSFEPESKAPFRRVEVCRWEDVPDGGNKAFLIEGASILICKGTNELYADRKSVV